MLNVKNIVIKVEKLKLYLFQTSKSYQDHDDQFSLNSLVFAQL